MNRAVFLDRDGTIIKDAHYLDHPDRINILPHTIDGLKALQKEYLLVVVTNQSGIGRGYFTESQFHRINNIILKIFKQKGILISRVYYSPYHPEAREKRYKEGEHFRKPNPGMILKAAGELDIDLAASWMIGDKESDITAGVKAGLKANIYIQNKKNPISSRCRPDRTVKNVDQAARWIMGQDERSGIFMDYQKIAHLAGSLKKKGKRIVFTNGVFDILHIGHIRYLRSARELGDVLIVGVNSDSSVKQFKDRSRPYVSQFARCEVLASLKCVDYCIIFHERDPKKIISLIKPHIHTKGGDYSMDQIRERKVVEQFKGKVVLLPVIKGYSTTNLINRIRRKK
ncbi:MAG: D-glycero-beta-D-manno-heptose 1-phosphate adenylyltransferase [Spirochaetes bacterium]|nr:D-glycero-beta-D-manno-heptose 1-phosphate adenylyltransferase [Spirochaetota bacterium]